MDGRQRGVMRVDVDRLCGQDGYCRKGEDEASTGEASGDGDEEAAQAKQPARKAAGEAARWRRGLATAIVVVHGKQARGLGEGDKEES